MKTNYLTTFFLTLLSISVFANDGVYLSRGSIIYSTKETKISLDKEILSFTVRDKIAQVDIQFEFNNPENVERKLMIGFQAPIWTGDSSQEIIKKNKILDFRILNDGEILPYKLKASECGDCELKDPKGLHFKEGESGLIVYLFEVTFKPGINRINHSYSFPASNNVAFDEIYNYILTTGSKWADGMIKDLTVQIDMGTNKYFFVHDIFGPNANWSIIGVGKVTNTKFYDFDSDSCRMVRVLSGKLQIAVKDFIPTKNIEFGIISENSFINRSTDLARILSGELLEIGPLNKDKVYTKDELRILRNTLYAQHGYAFKSKDLQDFFAQFEWYMPDPNLTEEQIVLSEKEKSFLNEISMKEKE